MFVDQITIEVSGGKGGDGIVAFRREYRVDMGGPFGGSGGRGGHVIFVAEEGLSTLLDFRYMRHIKGNSGEKGRTKGMTGAEAEDTYIRVPVGTTIYDANTNKVIADLIAHKQEAIIAQGGRGGRGNIAFATGANKAPSLCEKGEPGEEKEIRLELKVLADCGLVGFPSVGKSTLIAAVSGARPKIASYHFTTLTPNLGLVEVPDGRSFVMADLPGLIEGASQGLGLGFQFLRHIERCRVIVHVIDMASTEGRDPYQDYVSIRKELEDYQLNLMTRPEIIVANKMDEPAAEEYLREFKKHFSEDTIIIPISAYTGHNTDELLFKIADILAVTPNFSLYSEEDLTHTDYIFSPDEKIFDIIVEENLYIVTGEKLEKIFKMTDFSHDEAVRRFARQLRTFGVDDELRRLGIQNGDTVRVFEYEFEFFE